jgi:colanic acid/amylovoran biosynthesis glycosyltransferase
MVAERRIIEPAETLPGRAAVSGRLRVEQPPLGLPGRLGAPGRREGAPPLRLAYLVNKYPFVSHTFIRRELLDLERRGHSIMRLAIRDPGGAIADPLDRAEMERTLHVLKQPRATLALEQLRTAAANPKGYARALAAMTEMARRSDRGTFRHMAYLAEAAYLTGVLKRERVEHVHAHFGTNSATVARLIWLLGGPSYSFTVHGAGDLDAPMGYSLGAKMTDAKFVVAITDHCASQLRRWIPWEEWGKVHVVHCTVGAAFFDEARPIDPASNTLVCVGRLATEKGHMVLLDAFALATSRGLDARLVLAGDGELRPRIERRIDELGLRSRVEITGWISEAEVRQRLLQSRALVMASFNEGLPMVIMEAMALGRPAIATAIAGIPELVRNGQNGWLVTPGRPDLLADAMEEAVRAPVERLTGMAAHGQQMVLEQHFTPREGDKLEELLYRYVRG